MLKHNFDSCLEQKSWLRSSSNDFGQEGLDFETELTISNKKSWLRNIIDDFEQKV